MVVVDDGSKEPAEQQTSARRWPFRLRVVRQENRGAAAARHNGATTAAGEVILFIDDDMSVPPALLAEHLRLHDADPQAVVLGRIRRDPGAPMTLFERFHLRTLERLADGAREGRRTIRGVDVWTGNLSMRRAKYLEVGGFDFSLGHSEDAELGVRLEKSGARFRVSEEGYSLHSSDHTSLEGWMRRAFKYGVFDSRIGKKHADMPDTSPWRYFRVVNPVSRPFLAAAPRRAWRVPQVDRARRRSASRRASMLSAWSASPSPAPPSPSASSMRAVSARSPGERWGRWRSTSSSRADADRVRRAAAPFSRFATWRRVSAATTRRSGATATSTGRTRPRSRTSRATPSRRSASR